MKYRYYSTQRPVMPGGYPKPQNNEVLEIENFDNKKFVEEVGCQAWGYEERGDTLNSAAGNKFDGEPDCFMAAHIKVEYLPEEGGEQDG